MKVSCEIIIDLLPLYHDEVCSNESRIIIEEHLLECENCKIELQSIDEALLINNKNQNLREADAVQKLSRRWKKGMLKFLLKGVLITLLAIVVMALILYLFMDIKVVPKV